jgi:RHS repeat-associated protein
MGSRVASHHFPGYDGNGNVCVLVRGDTGAVTARYEYGPFGETIRVTGEAFARVNPFRFSTKYTDEESGFLYYGYRFYNPSTGRWLNRDPVGERGGLNRYGFVSNNPINRVDPLGLVEASGTVSGPSPWQVGWEWLSGTGEQHREFDWDDRMTQDLRRSPQIQSAIEAAKKALSGKCKSYRPGVDYAPYPVDAQGDASYTLSGWDGPIKYIRDYSVIATGEKFGGNLTVTFLGSFNGDWRAVGTCCTRRGRICFTIRNDSSLASGTRFPISGYWDDKYTATLWEMLTFQDFGIPSGIFPSRPPGSSGPGRTISQTFKWCEDISF